MAEELHGKVAPVTRSNQDIGRGSALELARAGCRRWRGQQIRRDRTSRQIKVVVLIAADCMIQSEFQQSGGNRS